MAFAEDLSVFFDPNEFGTRAWLDCVEVAGIFSNGHATAFEALTAASPSFVLPTAACVGATQESLLQVNAELVTHQMQNGRAIAVITGGTRYRVRSIEAGDSGLTTLRLELAP